MFIFLNKLKNNNRGQIGVVILLLVAIALLVYAVSLNLGKMSQSKMITDLAATQGASMLASQMASYGQQQLMSQLGGEFKVCESTGILGAIVSFVILVIVAIYAPALVGEAYGVVAQALAVIGAVAAGAAVVINITVIQPGITSAWNKITSQTLEIQDQFIEAGIQAGAGQVITDQVQVPDVTDFDLDGLFDTGGAPVDEIGRYAVYYQKARLENIQVRDIPAINTFTNGLLNFVFRTLPTDADCGGSCAPDQECRYGPDPEVIGDGLCTTPWALLDPVPVFGQWMPAPSGDRLNIVPITPDPAHMCHPANSPIPSECNPCCVPPTIIDPATSSALPQDVRPSCCDTGDPATECGVSTTCLERSPYGLINPAIGAAPGTVYAFVYDRFNEDYENNFFSFREEIGRDDEHADYSKEPTNPNYIFQSDRPGAAARDVVFSGRDATGYYTAHPPLAPDVLENRIGIQQILHKIYDGDRDLAPENHWGFDLSSIDPDTTTTDFWKSPACLMCDSRLSWASACDAALPTNMSQLALPIDVLNESYIFTDTSPCIDEKIDRVASTGIGIDPGQCGPADLSDPAITDDFGFWKAGSDLYCNEGDNPTNGLLRWPYSDFCDKHDGCFAYEPDRVTRSRDSDNNLIPVPCRCLDRDVTALPAEWPADPIDDLIYGTREFLNEAIILLGMSELSMTVTFSRWYENWRDYIDPGPADGALGVTCHRTLRADGTRDCQTNKGKLFIWRDNIEYMRDRLRDLRNEAMPVSAGGCLATDNANFTWCVPQAGCSLPLGEGALYSSGVRGSIDQVIACLEFNENNAPPFTTCATSCDAASCDIEFPRSNVPGFDPNAAAFTAPDPAYDADRLAFMNCLQNCSVDNCFTALPLPGAGPAPGYIYPDPAVVGSFDEAVDCPADAWTTGNAWYDAINDNLNLATSGVDTAATSCDMSTGGWLYNIFLSSQEAQNLDPKMALRRQFLEERVTEIDGAIAVLSNALTEFDNFISNEVRGLVDARIALDAADPSDRHPFHMIYGWMDEAKPGELRGPWHIIKVEARIPERCGSGNCDGDSDSFGPLDEPFDDGDVPWPRIRTYTKGFLNSTRCYELINLEGGVKFRVTRVDEIYDATTPGEVNLPGGLNLWRFLSGAPGRQDIPTTEWEGLSAVCRSLDNPSFLPEPPRIYSGAFLVNDREDDPVIRDCWDRASKLLSNGVSTETCAVYYGKRGDRPGFTFEFVPCELGGRPVF